MFIGLTATTDGAFEYQGDIAYSPSAFRNYLPLATNVSAFEDTGATLSATSGAKKWRITLGPERLEGIALLKMSRMAMQLRLEGYTRAEAEAFMERFWQYYQRGGG